MKWLQDIPGLRRAESILSGRLVAAITVTPTLGSKPTQIIGNENMTNQIL